MVLVELRLKLISINMSVDLGRANVTVPEKLLDHAQIRTALKKMSSETVAKSMNLGIHAAGSTILLEPLPDQGTGELIATAAGKDETAFGIASDQNRTAGDEILGQKLGKNMTDKDDALLVTLSDYTEDALLAVIVGHFQANSL